MTTTTTAATPNRLRQPNSIPTKIDISQIPLAQKNDDLNAIVPIPLVAGDRLAVRVITYRGQMSGFDRYFTVSSVAAYAAKCNEDVEAAVALSKERGEALYFAFSEGILITAHKQEPVQRFNIDLGSIIEMDGQKFQILQSPNENIEFVPFPTA